MTESRLQRNILIVDDEWDSNIVRSVRKRLDDEGWRTRIVVPFDFIVSGDDFEAEALYAIEEERPDGIVLDVRFGEHGDDRFKGLSILQKSSSSTPSFRFSCSPSTCRVPTGRRRARHAQVGRTGRFH